MTTVVSLILAFMLTHDTTGNVIGLADKEVSAPLKVATICPFRGIDVQVRIFRLERAKMPFPAEFPPLEMPFLPFSAFL